MELKQAKAVFLKKLAGFGIEETELIVAPMRKSRDGVVGYYSHMSQFRSRPRVVIDVAEIQANYMMQALVDEEVLLTLAHEYGHIIAEAIRELPRLSDGTDRFAVPDWPPVFDGDEEQFAEDFARYCVTYDARHEPFWEVFVPQYAQEFERIFTDTEGDTHAHAA